MPLINPVTELREAALVIAEKAEEIIGSEDHTMDVTVEIVIHGIDLPEVYIRRSYIPHGAYERRLSFQERQRDKTHEHI